MHVQEPAAVQLLDLEEKKRGALSTVGDASKLRPHNPT